MVKAQPGAAGTSPMRLCAACTQAHLAVLSPSFSLFSHPLPLPPHKICSITSPCRLPRGRGYTRNSGGTTTGAAAFDAGTRPATSQAATSRECRSCVTLSAANRMPSAPGAAGWYARPPCERVKWHKTSAHTGHASSSRERQAPNMVARPLKNQGAHMHHDECQVRECPSWSLSLETLAVSCVRGGPGEKPGGPWRPSPLAAGPHRQQTQKRASCCRRPLNVVWY